MQNEQHDDDHTRGASQAEIDLALLFLTDLHVGNQAIYKKKRPATSLNLRYEIDGDIHQRSYLSPLSWRAIMLIALTDRKTVSVHEMDQPGRYRQMFPASVVQGLTWGDTPANPPHIVKLHEPNGKGVMLLTKSRFFGHAVDALHNLTNGWPVFQPLWISDIMALRPMFGIDLVRDETFAPTLPVRSYLEAAATTGRIVDGPELLELPLTGKPVKLALPSQSKVISNIFNEQCRENQMLEKLRSRTIYEDYGFHDPANSI